ncbi:CubicO group peptidase, beta-lactamase class C family [Sphingomonas gellani]|uniref:CubicO group peptidase, beta-lactamase class C family n=1 Tax=Sphingomonas gellani TaxID=1166340 RepID=A0A1H8AMB9_9SPHN|nr:serine hydrolase domain-containing protein [Sphingomonas gellani]SEM71683.1 CubicO group peptidase, beta-lactamase class C family [Sphingomonas gellani]
MRRIWVAMLAALVGTTLPAQTPGPKAPPLTPAPALATPATTPIVTGGRAAHALTATDVDAWLDGYMPYALHTGDIAGAVVTVVKDGQVLTARGYGYADIAHHRPVDPARTLFRPGSVSKLVTWTAVMQQVQAGRLDLDRDVNTYLDFRIPARDGKPVTLRQIMTHTAGFEEAMKDLIVYDPKGVQTLGGYLKRWTPRRIFDAGTTPAYSNWATTLAAYIVERVSGVPFDTYVEQRIFAPLDMRTASFRQPLPGPLAPLVATGYPRASEPAKGFEIVVPAPAGALSASGLDMAKFMIAHLQNGRGVLNPATAAIMHNSPLNRVDPRSLIPPLNRMELGFFETNVNGREVIGHLGDTENFHTSLHLFMAEGVGFYVSFNSAGREGSAHTVRGQLFQDFADRYFPGSPPTGRVDARTAADHARLMTGLWQNSRHSESSFADILNLFGQTAVSVDDKGALVIPSLTGAGGGTRVWDEVSPFVWQERDGHERLAAQVRDGRVVRWSFDQIAPFMVFDRVPFGRSATWLKPALYISLAVLLLTALYWPATWWLRRRYATPIGVSGQALKAYRATRIMALADLLVLGGWTTFVLMAFNDLALMTSASDGVLWLLQIVGAVVFVGAVGIAAWNAWLAWRDGRGWAGKLWSVLVLPATIVVLYVASAFGLLAMTVNY